MLESILAKEYDLLDEDTRKRLVVDSLPKKLVEVAGERLDDLPASYTRAMIAASLSSKMVYNEGLEFINTMSGPALLTCGRSYLKRSDQLKEMMSTVENSDLPNKGDILAMLKLAGVKTAIALEETTV